MRFAKGKKQYYLPQRFELQDRHIIFSTTKRSVPVHKYKFQEHHVRWMFSRMFEFLLYMHEAGYAHLALNPYNILVEPETHAVVIYNFRHLTAANDKAKTIPGTVDHWYPLDAMRNGSIEVKSIDLILLQKTTLFLLGSRSGLPSVEHMRKPTPFVEFVLSMTEINKDTYMAYRNMLSKEYQSKFHKLNL